jgi:hypothetical protein
MARPYQDLTDQQLADEIAEYRAALKKVAIGGQVTDVGAEGRRMTVTPVNTNEVRNALDALIYERDYRAGTQRGGSIGVQFG